MTATEAAHLLRLDTRPALLVRCAMLEGHRARADLEARTSYREATGLRIRLAAARESARRARMAARERRLRAWVPAAWTATLAGFVGGFVAVVALRLAGL